MHVGYQPISSIPGGRMDVARDLYRKSAGSDRERDNQGYHDTLGSRDSYSLLLELALQEPTIQNCLKIVESTCLAQGFSVRIEKKNVSEEFQHHLQKYYLPFLSDAIRAMHVYGFVPWR